MIASQDFDSGLPAGSLSLFQDHLPSWSCSTAADTDNSKMDKTDVSSMSELRKPLLHVKQGFASLEKQLHTWDSRLYEVVGEMVEKLRTLELPKWWEMGSLRKSKNGFWWGRQHKQCCMTVTNLLCLVHQNLSHVKNSTHQWFMPVTLQDSQGSWNHPLRDDGDELWASLENIDQLALKSKAPTPSPGDKQHIRPSPLWWSEFVGQLSNPVSIGCWIKPLG